MAEEAAHAADRAVAQYSSQVAVAASEAEAAAVEALEASVAVVPVAEAVPAEAGKPLIVTITRLTSCRHFFDCGGVFALSPRLAAQ